MKREIERKFLVLSNDYKSGATGISYKQGYLSRIDDGVLLRVRIAGEKGYITIKSRQNDLVRSEFEYEIPINDANELMSMIKGNIVEKLRYKVEYKGFVWEIDEFLGDNLGLVIAEIELQDENEIFEKPSWIGEEVTFDHRYGNANLATNSFRNWT